MTEKSLESLQEENRRLHRAVEELSILNDLARVISSTLSVNQIMELIVQKSVKTIGVEQGSITLLSTEEAAPMKTLVRGADSSYGKMPYHIGVNLTGWMIKHQKPLITNDLQTDPRFRSLKDVEINIKSILSVPLKVKDRLIGSVNLFNKLKGSFTDADQRLLSIIGTQSAQVIENARLYEEEREKERLMRDLITAREIQMSLLPDDNPQLPGVDIAGRSIPAFEVGGDYFDFVPLEDNRLAITLGDVSGKGIPAALLMSNLQAALRSQASSSPLPKPCITQVNRLLHSCTSSEKFVTLFYGIFDAQKRSLHYTNAGHNPPLVIDPHGEYSTLDVGGIVIGAVPQFPYEEGIIQLNPGHILVMYSDGITETENEKEEQFGEERLIRIIREHADLKATEISERIIDQVNSFSQESPQQDDMTLIVMKVLE
ncbi:MAG: SpoIIE family protein phosphatase [Gemmatimonadota bacterium]|nr:MAG: SpoIIE family protein phosphatase [Gemmatimonadota bacterium]